MFTQTAWIFLCGLFSPLMLSAQQSDVGQRSPKEAMDLAAQFFRTQTPKLCAGIGEAGTTSAPTRLLPDSCSKEAYYIYQPAQQDSGFVIISGNERMPTILAYSDADVFDVSNLPPAVKDWLISYELWYDATLHTEADTPANNAQTTTELPQDTIFRSIAPLLGGNAWGQSAPYNALCPTVQRQPSVVGCVATAMAQVMKYHEYPDRGTGNIAYTTTTNHISLKHDLSTDTLAWGQMLDAYNIGTYTTASANAVATLMYDCGLSVQMDYCSSAQGGSGAYQYDLLPGFIEHFNYDPDASLVIRSYCTTEDWHDLLQQELNALRPVNYAGVSTSDGGHSFVIDGYRQSSGSTYPSYHVNWGWDGSCNGYYQIADLAPKEQGISAVTSGFSEQQQMTIGIQPDNHIDDHNGVLAASKIRLSATTLASGGSCQIMFTELYNLSYRTFQGTLSAVLRDAKGQEWEFRDETTIKLPYLDKKQNIALKVQLPQEMAEGTYQVRLRAYRNGDTTDTVRVLSSSWAQLTISQSGDTPTEDDKELTTELACGDSELVSVADSTQIELRLYMLRNCSEDAFEGTLQLLLADTSGRMLAVIGSAVYLPELGYNEMHAEHLTLRGQISDQWTDNRYRLYVGAQRLGKESYNNLSIYDPQSPVIDLRVLYYDVHIAQGVISIDGHEYYPSGTNLQRVWMEETSHPLTHDIWGRLQKEPGTGVFIQQGRKILLVR
jgi:hypothetical protein